MLASSSITGSPPCLDLLTRALVVGGPCVSPPPGGVRHREAGTTAFRGSEKAICGGGEQKGRRSGLSGGGEGLIGQAVCVSGGDH